MMLTFHSVQVIDCQTGKDLLVNRREFLESLAAALAAIPFVRLSDDTQKTPYLVAVISFKRVGNQVKTASRISGDCGDEWVVNNDLLTKIIPLEYPSSIGISMNPETQEMFEIVEYMHALTAEEMDLVHDHLLRGVTGDRNDQSLPFERKCIRWCQFHWPVGMDGPKALDVISLLKRAEG